MCTADCNEIQSNIHGWAMRDPRNPDSHVTMHTDHPLPDLSDFQEYQLEWTPYKMIMRVDGREIRRWHRFYQREEFSTNGPGGNQRMIRMRALDCGDFPTTDSVDVYEHLAWDRFARFRMDLHMGTSHNGRPRTDYGEMQVDYVRIEHRVPEYFATQNEPPAPGETRTYQLNQAVISRHEWRVSNNLEILDDGPDFVTLRKNDSGTDQLTLAVIDSLATCHFREINLFAERTSPAFNWAVLSNHCGFIRLRIDPGEFQFLPTQPQLLRNDGSSVPFTETRNPLEAGSELITLEYDDPSARRLVYEPEMMMGSTTITRQIELDVDCGERRFE